MSAAVKQAVAPLSFLDAVAQASAWPFEEARKIVKRIEASGQTEVLFETGYGPSGLPHIGTFGEVAARPLCGPLFAS